MIKHADLGDSPFIQIRKLKQLIDTGEVKFGGSVKLKIYGLLKCPAGKRMKVENRVFFVSEAEALHAGYRPCGRCMREDYLRWKKGGLIVLNDDCHIYPSSSRIYFGIPLAKQSC